MPASINHRYTILEKLGQGGMGLVYLVKDNVRNDQVMALKLVRANALGERGMAQFKYEFAALGQLNHPNLVQVYDFGTVFNVTELPADEQHLNAFFYTMEYIAGEDLVSWARHKAAAEPGLIGTTALDYTWLYEIIVQVCRALQYIHSRGLIHYDVKPHNVRIAADGQARLMDFGLIGEPRLSGQIKVRGTPDYIAPEIIYGSQVDQRADLYSLGVTIYEIVAGKLPFNDTSTLAVMRQHLDVRPILPAELKQDLPEGLQSLIAKLLEKDPAERYQNAGQIIQAINTFSGLNFTLETRSTQQVYIQSAGFVGREAELARLQGLLMRMLQGQGQMVFIAGAAGMGKHRLARELKVRAQLQHSFVCEGICLPNAQKLLAPWAAIFRQLVPQIRAFQPQTVRENSAILIKIFPELANLLPALTTGRLMLQVEPEGMVEQAAQFLLSIDQPTVIILEDLQYADPASIALLHELAREIGHHKLLLIGLYRDDEVSDLHPLQKVLGDFRDRTKPQPDAESAVEVISLNPLSRAEVETYVRSMLGGANTAQSPLPATLIEHLMEESGGNPTFIQSIMQIIAEEGLLTSYDEQSWNIAFQRLALPANIQEAARRQLSRLDQDLLGLLQWAAALGDWLELDALIAVCGQPADQVLGLMNRSAWQHVLEIDTQADEASYRFSTQAMREAIYQTIPLNERFGYHRKIQEVLTTLFPEDKIVEPLAWHALRSENPEQALAAVLRAGDKSAQEHALAAAVRYYDEGMKLLEQYPQLHTPIQEFDLRSKRERCYVLIGNRTQQAAELEGMERLAAAIKDPIKQILVLNRQAEFANLTGNRHQAQQAAEKAVELARQVKDRRLEAQGLTNLGDLYYLVSQFDRAQLAHEEALSIYQELNDLQGQAANWRMLGRVHLRVGRMDQAISHNQRSLKICREIGDERGQAGALALLGIAVTDAAQARIYNEQALAIRRSIGDRIGQASSYNNLGVINCGLGLYNRALEYMQQAVELAQSLHERRRLGFFLESLGRVYLALGRLDEAEKNAIESLNIARETGDRWAENVTYILLVQILLKKNLLDDALDKANQAVTLLQELKAAELSSALAWRGAVYLAQNNWQAALKDTTEAIHVTEGAKTNTDYPLQDIWWQHYRVLRGHPQQNDFTTLGDETWDALQKAHHALMSGIATLSDEALRRSYLNKVEINRTILLEYTRQLARRTGEPLPEYIESSPPTETEQAKEKLKRVLSISAQMNETRDTEALLNYVIDQVIELSGAERGFLVLIDESGQMELRVARGMADDELERAKAQISYTVLGEVAQSKKTVLLQDAMADERFSRQSSVLDLNLRSVLCVPLLTRSELVGMIYTDNRSVSGRFSLDDVDLMTVFANQAATSIENTRLYEQLETWAHTLEQRVVERTHELETANSALSRRAMQLETSSQVSRQATSILMMDELLYEVVRLIQEGFDYYAVSVWLATPTRSAIQLQAGISAGGKPLSLQSMEIRMDAASIIASVCRSGEYRLVDNVQTASDYLVSDALTQTQAELALPLRMGNLILGVLDIEADQSEAFKPDDLKALETLADQIAIAIRNAQLYQSEQDRRHLADNLRSAGREIATSLDFLEVPVRILEQLALLVPNDRATLILEGQDQIIAQRKQSPAQLDHSPVLLQYELDAFQQMLQGLAPVLIDDVSRLETSQGQDIPYKSWLGVPLISQSKTIGMMTLERRKIGGFSPQDTSIAATFATQAAAALENARLYAQIRRFNEQLEQMVQQRTEELRRAYENLERLDKNKSDFINVAAHELRTPLTIIRGYAQFAQLNDKVSTQPELKQMVDGIVRGSDRMYEVVNSMLDISRITSQTLAVQKESISLVSLINVMANKFRPAIQERQQQLEIRAIDTLPFIKADQELISKVFHHLLINAIKYTPDGGKITICLNRYPKPSTPGEQQYIEVTVIDNGIGIDQAFQELIFEKFFQMGEVAVHSSGQTKFKGGGPGLGLAIARGIVNAHNGRIWVESSGHDEETRPGSSFHVILPI